MGPFPDWNSIEGTARWSEGLFWVGIAALILVAVTELAAHVYGNRAAYLVVAHDRIEGEARQGQVRQAERHYSAETAILQQKLDRANAQTASLQQKLDRASAETKSHQQKLDRANAETASLQQKLDRVNAILHNFKSSNARHLSERQANELQKSLVRFAGQKIKVWSSDAASDSITLGHEFVAALKMAGWVVPDRVLTGPVAGGDTEGIQVVFEGDLSNPNQIPRGIDTLIATLERIGLISGETLYVDHTAHGREYLLKIGRTRASARTKS